VISRPPIGCAAPRNAPGGEEFRRARNWQLANKTDHRKRACDSVLAPPSNT
jgi:hypothetical protein